MPASLHLVLRPGARKFAGEFRVAKQIVCHAFAFRAGQPCRHERIALNAQFVALPVIDPLDNERVVCYRSFLPAKNALV